MSHVTDLCAVLLKTQTWILRMLDLVRFFIKILALQLWEGFNINFIDISVIKW